MSNRAKSPQRIAATLFLLILAGLAAAPAGSPAAGPPTGRPELPNATKTLAAAAPKPQGNSPFAIAITNDGKYGYIGFDLSDVVFKVRLEDLSIQAVADLSAYFPMESESIALDPTDTKLFVDCRTWQKLLVLDAQTMSTIRVIDNIAPAGMTRSRYAPVLIVPHGRGMVKLINTETLAVTEFRDDRVSFEEVRESSLSQDKWFVLSGIPDTPDYKVGLYDRKMKAWDVAVTLPPQPGGQAIFDFQVLPNERKLYVAAYGGAYPDGPTYGWLYSVDLMTGQLSVLAIDGGAYCLAASRDSRWVFVGPGTPRSWLNSLLVVDTQSDTVVNEIQLGRNKTGWAYTSLNDLEIDPANPNLLYGTSSDANALIKVRLDALSLSDVLVFNEETFHPNSFARRPGQPSGYILTSGGSYGFELDIDNATIKRAVKFPSYGGRAAVNKAGRLLMAQGQSFLQIDPLKMSVVAIHRLPQPMPVPAVWDFLLSRDETKIYAIPWAAEPARPDTLVVVDTSTFEIDACVKLAGGGFLSKPYELPDRPKLYALGGVRFGNVVIHVIDTRDYRVQKTITLSGAASPGLAVEGNYPHWPFAYDSRSHTLFTGAEQAVLALDTERDVVKKVIDLGDAARAVGLEPWQLTYGCPTSLVYHPQENYLYISNLDRGFVSVYDLTNERFLPRLIPLRGFFPRVMFASDDYSKLYCLNDRSDSVSVIDVKSKREEKVIDLHVYLPNPEPLQPAIGVSPAELSFSFETGGKVPASEVALLWRVGGSTTTWSAASSGDWLGVSPSFGWTPAGLNVSVRPEKLGPGSYTGAVTVSSPDLPSQTIKVTLRVTAPVPGIGSIVNAASFQPGMVPGGLATLFGRNLSLITGTELPGGATSYKGVFVAVEGQRLPLLAVSNAGGQEQINFQVPFELGTPARVRVEVNNNGSVARVENVPVLRVQPGIFEYAPPGSSSRYAAAVKLDGSVVGPTNPASRGEVVSLFLTGMGPVLPVLRTGEPGPADPPAVTWLQPAVAVGGIAAEVLFSGYAPGLLGLYQVNVVIPDATPTGTVNLDLVVDGVRSETSRIAVQ